MKKEKQLSRKTKLTFDNKKPVLYCLSSKKKKNCLFWATAEITREKI